MRKIIKSADSDAAQAFRLHYFPNIPVGAAGVPEAGGAGGAFRTLVPAAPETLSAEASPAGASPVSPAEIERQAYREGFARGERDGRAAAARQVEPVLAGLQQLVESLEAGRQKLRREAEQEVVALALAVARKVVGQALASDAAALAGIVREAVGRTEASGSIQVRMHPDDLQRLREAHAGAAALLAGTEHVRFEADPAVEGGGCLVETDFGQIDARVATQFQAIEEAFRAALMPSAE